MERMLQKIARQLAAYDEASLMALWEKYYRRVNQFQPTKQWERDTLVFCFLQAVRWKNQLFNSKWAEQRNTEGSSPQHLLGENAPLEREPGKSSEGEGQRGRQKGKVLTFPGRGEDKE